ncbi:MULTISPECIES: hypothetical protein [unclassified Shewanella]|uniref:hypothetical protein n=1 Tax=unclassified Shewanella TaxID=196818 RepID=UPI001BC536BF|nr:MULTISPECIES: hypothetical protein [unclassified Shewanella]GIU09518.1 hypothetical protein TUM4444_12270 [Shewanella sp. MBTL60-112-B1]GIU34017.1 hypothetical protein TUM4445_22090 [Shewanella sp. MBTL60-112-B2]
MQTTKINLLQTLNSDRVKIGCRALSAIFAGYLLAATVSSALALALPFSPIDNVLAAMMLSFAVYACAAIWAFSVQSHWRAISDLVLLSGLVYLIILAIG